MSSNGVINPAVLLEETVWLDATRLQESEARYEEYLANERQQVDTPGQGDSIKQNPIVANLEARPTSSLASEIAHVRSRIQNFMKATDNPDSLFSGQLVERIENVEKQNAAFKTTLFTMSKDMQALLEKVNFLDKKVLELEKKQPEKSTVKNVDAVTNGTVDDDDDIDLFGSDEETEEDRRIKEDRAAAVSASKKPKKTVIAKSSVVLDVKPWSDETDLKEMETLVRKIESAGLKWGAAKLVPLAYGIKKLQILAIVEDDNCSIDWLQEQIEAIEDLVQSVDIAAFNKL